MITFILLHTQIVFSQKFMNRIKNGKKQWYIIDQKLPRGDFPAFSGEIF